MAEAPKGGGEIWAAGIGRKSNAQYGSDLMVEVLRELGIKYIALNPGASYRGLHDSMVNFEPGKGPEIIMCTHEEIAVAIANGYARATGEIMATGLHDIVGLQHASMAIYNAWADRLPVIVLGGTGPVAPALLSRPPDLRHLSGRYGTPLDGGRLGATIDGRESVVAHGNREMPVWGERFDALPPDEDSRERTMRSSPLSAGTMNSCDASPPMGPLSASTGRYSRPHRAKIRQ